MRLQDFRLNCVQTSYQSIRNPLSEIKAASNAEVNVRKIDVGILHWWFESRQANALMFGRRDNQKDLTANFYTRNFSAHSKERVPK